MIHQSYQYCSDITGLTLCLTHNAVVAQLGFCLILLSCSDSNSLFPWNGFAMKCLFIAFDEEAAKASETNGRISVTTGTEQQND